MECRGAPIYSQYVENESLISKFDAGVFSLLDSCNCWKTFVERLVSVHFLALMLNFSINFTFLEQLRTKKSERRTWSVLKWSLWNAGIWLFGASFMNFNIRCCSTLKKTWQVTCMHLNPLTGCHWSVVLLIGSPLTATWVLYQEGILTMSKTIKL